MSAPDRSTRTDDFAGYTPGPWRSGFNDGSGPAAIVTYAEDATFRLPELVAYVGPHGDPELRGEMNNRERANARLIAAAPDLLAERDALRERCERLEKALRHIAFEPLCGGRPEATHAQCLDDATRIARAALAEGAK